MNYSLRRPGIAVNSDGAVPREEAQVTVVQCPACRASFAVDTEVIAQHEYPRFHCSRCDNVFGYELAQPYQEVAHRQAGYDIEQPADEARTFRLDAHEPEHTTQVLDFSEAQYS